MTTEVEFESDKNIDSSYGVFRPSNRIDSGGANNGMIGWLIKKGIIKDEKGAKV